MRRLRSTPLRGSVTQNSVTRVHMRAPREKRSFSAVLARLGILAVALLIVIGTCAWLWHIGWPQREADKAKDYGLRLTQAAQFAVTNIVVEGRGQTSQEAIVQALGSSAETGSPILAFDAKAAQGRITKLPWVASVTVERRLPDTIFVHVTERTPLARWQHDNKTVVIDAEGVALPDANAGQFGNLPLVVGADAPAETQNLLTSLKDHDDITRVMTAAVRVSERRWDLHLEPNVVARLPEKDIDGALKRLSDLITNKKILDRDIAAIDLRLPDRLVIEPAGQNSGDAKAGDEKL